MDILHTVSELRQRLASEQRVVFVPTMGNLHEGHLDLLRAGRSRGDCLVASLFVNRLQFGQGEDFERYPRTLETDCEQLEKQGCHVVFAPDEKEVYPEPQQCVVEPSGLQHVLEGATRPGHFRGVATVVLKLFNMVRPQVAVFGQKDYQQCLVVKEMVRQLNLPIDILTVNTRRAPDGLALSSRNGYLSPEERQEAPALYHQLSLIQAALAAGQRDFCALEREATNTLDSRGWQTDYIAIRERHRLGEPDPSATALVILGAAKLGRTRLIDNIEVNLSP